MVVGLNTIRLMAGIQWAPAEAQFVHQAPRDTTEHTRLFGAPVSFGRPTNALRRRARVPRSAGPGCRRASLPDPETISRQCLEGDAARGQPCSAQIRRAVGESLRDGDPKLAQVAGKLTTTPRTLQRRLREHGVDFKRVVDDTRRRFSLNYLRDPKHTLTEIAYLLGYSEVSAFNRAFKRWTGATPSSYRRKVAR